MLGITWEMKLATSKRLQANSIFAPTFSRLSTLIDEENLDKLQACPGSGE